MQVSLQRAMKSAHTNCIEQAARLKVKTQEMTI